MGRDGFADEKLVAQKTTREENTWQTSFVKVLQLLLSKWYLSAV